MKRLDAIATAIAAIPAEHLSAAKHLKWQNDLLREALDIIRHHQWCRECGEMSCESCDECNAPEWLARVEEEE
jgi:hypothetical protein